MKLQDALQKYKGGNGGEFLRLQNHGDSATGRFLYGTDAEEFDWYLVYPINIGGKFRYVLQNGDNDPFAMAGKRPSIRALLQFYDVNEQAIKIWDRGKNDLEELMLLMNNFNCNLFQVPITITRNGAKGDKQTKYMKIPGQMDGTTREQLPAKLTTLINGHKGIYLQFTDAEMSQYLANPNGFVLNKETTNAPVAAQPAQQYAAPAPAAAPQYAPQPAPMPQAPVQQAPVQQIQPQPTGAMVNTQPMAQPLPVAPVQPMPAPTAAPVQQVAPSTNIF